MEEGPSLPPGFSSKNGKDALRPHKHKHGHKHSHKHKDHKHKDHKHGHKHSQKSSLSSEGDSARKATAENSAQAQPSIDLKEVRSNAGLSWMSSAPSRAPRPATEQDQGSGEQKELSKAERINKALEEQGNRGGLVDPKLLMGHGNSGAPSAPSNKEISVTASSGQSKNWKDRFKRRRDGSGNSSGESRNMEQELERREKHQKVSSSVGGKSQNTAQEFSNDGSFMDSFRKELASSKASDAKTVKPAVPSTLPTSVPSVALNSHVPEQKASVQANPDELNRLKAQALKAKLKGNIGLHEELMAKVQALHSGTASADQSVEVLPEISMDGKILRASTSGMSEHNKAQHDQRAKSKTVDGFGKDRFFQDDGMNLQQVIAQDRMQGGSAGKMDRNLMKSIMNAKNFKGGSYDEDDEYGAGLEHTLKQYESKSSRISVADLEKRERDRQIREAQKINSIQNNCYFCMDSPKFNSGPLIACGTQVYLALAQRPIVKGHCIISTIEHVPSGSALDEGAAEEVRNFKKCLIQSFSPEGKELLFMETVKGLNKRPHLVIEAVPMPSSAMEFSEMYFQKALRESGSEWSTHRKIIDTRGKRFVSHSIPKNFPYFHVEFGVAGGFAQVIEDEQSFSWKFGLEVVAGLLEIPGEVVARLKRLPHHEERVAIADMKKKFTPFDWTRDLIHSAPQKL